MGKRKAPKLLGRDYPLSQKGRSDISKSEINRYNKLKDIDSIFYQGKYSSYLIKYREALMLGFEEEWLKICVNTYHCDAELLAEICDLHKQKEPTPNPKTQSEIIYSLLQKAFTKEQHKELAGSLRFKLTPEQISVFAQQSYEPEKIKLLARFITEHWENTKVFSDRLGEMNVNQLHQIELAVVSRMPAAMVKILADPQLSGSQMQILREGLQSKKRNARDNYALYSQKGMSAKQARQVLVGLEYGLTAEQVSLFAKKKYDWRQMVQLRKGLEHGLTDEQVSIFSSSKFNAQQMEQIRLGLVNGLSDDEVKRYAVFEKTASAMEKKRKALERILAPNRTENQAPNEPPSPYFPVNQKRYIDRSEGQASYPEYLEKWNTSRRVFLFDEAFAKSLLSHIDAVLTIPVAMLTFCKFSTGYVIANDENSKSVEFFFSVDERHLQLHRRTDIAHIEAYRLNLCSENKIAAEIESFGEDQKWHLMQMLQLFICMVSGVQDRPTQNVTKQSDLAQKPKSSNQTLTEEIPDWDVDIYTVYSKTHNKNTEMCPAVENAVPGHKRRPHIRAAHWTHPWYGSGNNKVQKPKWIPEIEVNGETENLPVQVRIIRGRQ